MNDGMGPGEHGHRTKAKGPGRAESSAVGRGTPGRRVKDVKPAVGLGTGFGAGDGAGRGSLAGNVAVLLEWLPTIIDKYNINVINDAGCGRRVWIPGDCWGTNYKGYDAINYDGVTVLDITVEKMRKADLIICKDVFRHLPDVEVQRALDLFDAKYLICDTVLGAPSREGPERPINMTRFLGKSLEVVRSLEALRRPVEWWQGKFWGLWVLGGTAKG